MDDVVRQLQDRVQRLERDDHALKNELESVRDEAKALKLRLRDLELEFVRLVELVEVLSIR